MNTIRKTYLETKKCNKYEFTTQSRRINGANSLKVMAERKQIFNERTNLIVPAEQTNKQKN